MLVLRIIDMAARLRFCIFQSQPKPLQILRRQCCLASKEVCKISNLLLKILNGTATYFFLVVGPRNSFEANDICSRCDLLEIFFQDEMVARVIVLVRCSTDNDPKIRYQHFWPRSFEEKWNTLRFEV